MHNQNHEIPGELSEFFDSYEFLHRRSLIHLAAVCNNGRLTKILEDLCRQDPKQVDELDDTQLSPLMLAACWGRDDSLQVLISQGANPEIKGIQGKTALILAAEEGQDTIISLLLKAGADFDAVDNLGLNAFHHAMQEEHFRCAQIIQNAKERASRSIRTVAGSDGNVRPFVALSEPASGGQTTFRYCQIAATLPPGKEPSMSLAPKLTQSRISLF